MNYYVYILANWNNKVMYVGVTNNLDRRMYEHISKVNKGFAEKYNVNKLVYYESTNDIKAAIAREKQIKGWTRTKKNELVETMNPAWVDLYPNGLGDPSGKERPQDDTVGKLGIKREHSHQVRE